ncbi:MAG: zf-HC2 domain-containing protein [Planctomycetes bacterium]|nr:zf-HC2 domain-containing protein [Planctomycetota bacterium]
MNCTQARQLFDAYLDGELSSSLVTELSAHRVRCAGCRRELALLEVTGRVLQIDQEPVQVGGDFTDRLLACVETESNRWIHQVRRRLYLAVPLTAAAVIALAVFGVFDRGTHPRVAGMKVERPPMPASHHSLDSRAVDAVLGTLNSDCPNDISWLDENAPAASGLQSTDLNADQSTQDLTLLKMLQLMDNGPSTNDRSSCPPHDAATPLRQPSRDTDDKLEPL